MMMTRPMAVQMVMTHLVALTEEKYIMVKDTEIRSEEEVRQTLEYLIKEYNRLGTEYSDKKKELGKQIDDLKWFLKET